MSDSANPHVSWAMQPLSRHFSAFRVSESVNTRDLRKNTSVVTLTVPLPPTLHHLFHRNSRKPEKRNFGLLQIIMQAFMQITRMH